MAPDDIIFSDAQRRGDFFPFAWTGRPTPLNDCQHAAIVKTGASDEVCEGKFLLLAMIGNAERHGRILSLYSSLLGGDFFSSFLSCIVSAECWPAGSGVRLSALQCARGWFRETSKKCKTAKLSLRRLLANRSQLVSIVREFSVVPGLGKVICQ